MGGFDFVWRGAGVFFGVLVGGVRVLASGLGILAWGSRFEVYTV